MPKSKIVLESRFPQVKDAADSAVKQARDRALNAGEGEAENRIERVNDDRGYELPIDIQQDKEGQGGRIYSEPFYMKFFEYGTVFIPASPFMRPAHRKMRKTFVDEMDDNFEGWVRRKARVK